MTALNIRTWADARAFAYTAIPVLGVFLVGYGALEQSAATLWVALALAIVGPALAAVNTVNGFRTWFYVVLGAANAVAVAYGALNAGDLEVWLPVVNLILGGAAGGVAVANTNTSVAE